MKPNLSGILLLLMLFCKLITAQNYYETSSTFLQLLNNGNYAEAAILFDEDADVNTDFLKKTWQRFINSHKEIISTDSVFTSVIGKYQAVYRIVTTAESQLLFTFLFTPEEKIKTFRYTYYLPELQYHDNYGQQDTYEETILQFKSDQYIMSAAYTFPLTNNDSSIVLLLQGSGPSDRDETMGPNKPFADIAHGLAINGIASFRFDKRTYIYPESFSNKNGTVWDEYGYDALAATNYLIDVLHYKPDNIFILGHSLGGMVAPRIVDSLHFVPAGLILVSAGARPLHSILHEQFKYIFKKDGLSKSEKQQLKMIQTHIENVDKLDPNNPQTFLNPVPMGAPASYWYDLKKYNQCNTLSNQKTPVLILQGKRDYQVTIKDYKIWKKQLKNHPSATFVLFKSLNHLMIPGTGKILPEEYQKPSHVSLSFIEIVSTWIKNK